MIVEHESVILVEGEVREVLQSGAALVQLLDGSCIQAELSARIRVRFIGVRPGDFVRCEVSPYDPAKARIIEKLTG